MTGRWARAWLCVVAGLLAFGAAPAAGQAVCPAAAAVAGATTAGPEAWGVAWPPPLDRAVTVQAASLSLREALERLARAGGLRLTYSPDLLPLERRVCVAYDGVPVGRALAELVAGAAVEPVVAGADHVVLAPVAEVESAHGTASRAAVPEPEAAEPVVVLDRMVVIGAGAGEPARSVGAAGSTLDAAKVIGPTSSPLPEILNANTPGVWAWQRSAAGALVRYGSIRGASSFGANYPKVYIDGIELANPQLMAHLTSEAIERVEVIRGPQGAALYGTDALGGVINIVTRHEDLSSGVPRLRVRSAAGFTESDFARNAVVAQEHAVTLRGGSSQRSAGLNVSVGSLGDYVPGASTRHLTASGNTRLVAERAVVTGTARLYLERGGVGVGSPVGPGTDPYVPAPGAGLAGAGPGPDGPHSIRQYTVGATAALMQGDRVDHTIVLGLDGYRLNDVPVGPASPSAGGVAAGRTTSGEASRATVRWASTARFEVGHVAAAALTGAVEHSTLHERALGYWDYRAALDWRRNTGLVTQADAVFLDALHLTGGVRLERNDAFYTATRYTLLPMLGGALVRDAGDLSVKLRAAYGRGIRPARTSAGGPVWRAYAGGLVDAVLEEQSGVEAGIDLYFGRWASLQVTRFDQAATGPVHPVGSAAAGHGPGAMSGANTFTTAARLLSVGEIGNRGWEVQGTVTHGRMSLGATASLVDSRVRSLAYGYTGDLRPGDRVLEVPAWTASVTGAWTGTRWSGSLTAYRAGDWINYDRLALFDAGVGLPAGLAGLEAGSPGPSGEALRAFWRRYDGVTHLRAAGSLDLWRGLALTLTGDNLLNRQGGEPDNAAVLPGRTVTVGLRAAF